MPAAYASSSGIPVGYLFGQRSIMVRSEICKSVWLAIDDIAGWIMSVKVVDVLNAESQAYNTMRDLIRTMLDTLMSQFRLKAAVGTLGEPDVVAVNALLER